MPGNEAAIIEIHLNGDWVPAAELRPLSDDRCRFEYLTEYVFSDEAQPLALGLPVAFDAGHDAEHRPPPFLYDMVPQGKGRHFLLKLLGRGDGDGVVLPLLMAGAFNPIGRLRLDSAMRFFDAQAKRDTDRLTEGGLRLEDILQRSDEFLEHISLHAMLAAGTTGVQGVAPKYLMAQNAEGGWYADLALPDDQARAHWLMKLPRGRSDDDRAVLRNEAAYLRLAKACGLRAIGDELGGARQSHPPVNRPDADPAIQLHGEMLFVRRFDRQVVNGRVHRLHQESLASLAGLRGFGAAVTQNELLAAIRQHATDAAGEALEFLKRDVLNLAMRNTDNHARNTAMQRTLDGEIRLTPVFDFAPMFMDPDVVPRSAHWRDGDGHRLDDWREVVDELSRSGALPAAERDATVASLRAFSGVVAQLPALADACGVEPRVLEQCRRSIDTQAEQLARLN